MIILGIPDVLANSIILSRIANKASRTTLEPRYSCSIPKLPILIESSIISNEKIPIFLPSFFTTKFWIELPVSYAVSTSPNNLTTASLKVSVQFSLDTLHVPGFLAWIQELTLCFEL